MKQSGKYKQPELPACAGNYRLDQLIAESDRSAVYLATSEDSGESVVVKKFEARASQAFMHETAISLQVNHPSVLGCEDSFYTSTGEGCIVYKYMSGGTLRDYLASKKVLGLDEIVHCLEQVLEGLGELHAHGWLHCDLKPENIYLKESNGKKLPEFLIGDLGSCYDLGQESEGHSGAGTPAYSAPETIFGQKSPSSDLYSLGVVAYELATGELPFKGSVSGIQKAHLRGDINLEAVANPEFRNLLAGLLENDPRNRLSDAGQVLALLREFIARLNVGSTAELVASDNRIRFNGNEIHYKPVQKHGKPAIYLRDIGSDLVLVISNGAFVDVISLDQSRHVRSFVVASGIVLLGDGDLCYRSGRSLVKYSASKDSFEFLCSLPQKINALACRGTEVFWSDEAGYHLLDYQDGQRLEFDQAREMSGSRATAAIMSRGVITSEGLANSVLAVYSSDGDAVSQFHLPGPVMALVSSGKNTWALTFGTQRQSCNEVWNISPRFSINGLVTGSPVVNWCVSESSLNLLLEDMTLVDVDDNGVSRSAPIEEIVPLAFSVSASAEKLALLYEEAPGKYRIKLTSIAFSGKERSP